jgi:acyl-coenzyme A thioesterase PaaI-like protein
MSADLSIQERLYPELNCFGCGPANARGLRLRSFREGSGVVAGFRPWPEHDNGGGFLNGGIIATVLDCHSGAAVFDHQDRLEGREPDGPPLPFVTAGLDVRFLRPCPLDQMLALTGEVTRSDPDERVVHVALSAEGRTRAEAVALWKRWRPR